MRAIIASMIWFLTVAVIFLTLASGALVASGKLSTADSLKALYRPGILSGSPAPQAATAEENPSLLTLTQEMTIQPGDARAQIVANFLERYKSPLQPYDQWGIFFVALADQYSFDFRLLPAISMQESGLCKTTPPNSHNCLGLGVHKRGTWEFDSYQANFEAAAKILKENYIDKGLTTPVEIMGKYTPSSNGSWANSVNQWFAEMRYDDRQLGREMKKDASVLEFAQPTIAPAAE